MRILLRIVTNKIEDDMNKSKKVIIRLIAGLIFVIGAWTIKTNSSLYVAIGVILVVLSVYYGEQMTKTK